MSINSTQLFQSVGTLNSNGFLVISDANVPSNEISANDITCLVVENEITNYDLSFSNTENVHAKTVVYSENTFIKPTTITSSYTGYNTSSEYQSLRIVDKNDELFIGSTNNSFKALVKSTNGTTWTDISSSLTSCEQVLICRDDDETYVAVGQGATPILYSYDGVYWVDASCNGLFTKVNGVAYGNGVYVAVGEGANTIAYSYDAVQWVGLGSSIFSSGGNSVIYANGVWVGCGGSSNTLAHSSDGINWTGLGNTIFTSNGNSLIYAKDTYVCLGEGTSDSLAYSSDGISWIGIGNSLLTSGFSVDYGNGRFIAGGQGNHTLIYSLDGVNWTAYTTSLFTTECRSVGYAGTTWYICGDTQGATVYISEDGIVWNLQSGIDFHLTSVDYRYLHSVRFPAKHMVALGDDSSHTISWSSNGTTWNDVSGSGDMFLEGNVACYNGKYWIAGGSKGILGVNISNKWEFENASIVNNTITDSVNGEIASLVYLEQSDIDASGITLDASNTYIDLGSDSIVVGGINFTVEASLKNNATGGATPLVIESNVWSQLGDKLLGTVDNGKLGISSAISGDGTVVAGGSYISNATDSGYTRVWKYNTSAWTQMGTDIIGESSGDRSGESVSLSEDGNIIAIGSFYNSDGGVKAGHCRVFQYDGADWIQLGQDIDGIVDDERSGISVSLSSDGTIVAVGSVYGIPDRNGITRIYEYNGTLWSQIGSDIIGIYAGDYAGERVSLSSNGTIIAIGARRYGSNKGSVNMYEYNGSDWGSIGTIYGEANSDYFGIAVSLSSDGTTVAIGATGNDSNGKSNAGHVRVLKYTGSAWSQLGQDIDGLATSDSFGGSVSISADGSIVAIGAIGRDPNGLNIAGQTTIYQYMNGTWNQIGQSIDGLAAGDQLGCSVGISSKGTTVVVGIKYDDTSATNAGALRVFQIPSSGGESITQTIMTLGNDENNKIELTAGENTRLRYVNSGTIYDITSSNILSDPSIIKATFDTSMNFYIDNALVGSVDIEPLTQGSTYTYNYFGCDLSASSNFEGTIAYISMDLSSSIPSEDTSYNLAYSQDGKTWTGILSNVFDSSVQGLVFDQTHNLMIACGTGSINTLAYSYDYGITWIGLGKSIFSTSGNAVAHNGEIWVAVGLGNDNTIAYSTDGLNWIGLGKTIFSTSGNAITYNNNLWVATGEGTNAIARSSDGKIWTGVTNTSLGSGYSVAGHGSNWLAGGMYDGSLNLVQSVDGENWSSVTTTLSGTKINSILWNGSQWLIGGEGTDTLAYSLDGITWASLSNSVFDSTVKNISYDSKIPYMNIQHPVLACIQDSTNTMAYSVDGVRWTGLGNSAFSEYGTSAFWNGYTWVAVGKGSNTIAYSLNMLDWTGLGSTLFSVEGINIHYGGFTWVAVGSGVDHTIGYSYNGYKWTGLGNSIFSVKGNSCAYNGSLWVAVGEGGQHTIATSPDGITWTGLSNTIFSVRGTCVIFTGTLWLATGSGTNTLAYSYDGTTWTGLGSTTFSVQGNGVAYDEHKLMAVGEGTNSIATSQDGGLTWVGQGVQTFNLRGIDVEYTGKWWMACGEGADTVVYSKTGESWNASLDSVFSTSSSCASTPVTITVDSEYIGPGHSTYKYTTSDASGNGGLFGCIYAPRGSTLTIYVVGAYAELVSHPMKITGYNDQGQAMAPLAGVVRTELTEGPTYDGTYSLTWTVPNDTTVDKYQYQCENHSHMRGTIDVSHRIKGFRANKLYRDRYIPNQHFLQDDLVVDVGKTFQDGVDKIYFGYQTSEYNLKVPNETVMILLNGDKTVYIEKKYPGYPYIEYGATSNSNHIVSITGSIDTTVEGTYKIIYSIVNNEGFTIASAFRDVIVRDTIKPVIILIGDETLTIEKDHPYNEPGYTASDFDNIDMTNLVIVTNNVDTSVAATYSILYNVSDSAGNSAIQKVRTVIVQDTSLPVITLVGETSIVLEIDSSYNELGYSGSDFDSVDLTSSVIISGTVDTSTVGTYSLYYDLTDNAGNASIQQTRTIVIQDSTLISDSTKPQYSWDFRTNTIDNIIYDDINNYVATLYNNPTIDGVDGVLTGGYGSMNSNGQYVDLQDFAFGAPEFSIEVYFKFVYTSDWQRIFDIGNADGNSNIVLYRNYNNPNEIILILFNGTNTIIDYASGVMSGTNLQSGVYYHVFVTFSSDTIKVYIDNSLVKTFTGDYSTFLNATRTNAFLGRSNWPNDNNQGQINYRYFRVYDKTLSETRRQYFYDNRDNSSAVFRFNLSTTNIDINQSIGIGTAVSSLSVISDPDEQSINQSNYSYSIGGTDASLFTIDGNVLKSAQVFGISTNLTGVLTFYYKGRKTKSNGVFQVSCIDLDTNAETILEENVVAVANNTWVLKTISIDQVFTSSNITLKFRKTDNGAGSAFIWNPTLIVNGTDILDGRTKASDSTSLTLTGISSDWHMNTSPTNYSDVGFSSTSFFHILHSTGYRNLIFELPEILSLYSIDISVENNGITYTKPFQIYEIRVSDFALSNSFLENNLISGSMVGNLSVISTTEISQREQLNYTYSISGTDASLFTIDGNVLKSAQAFDISTNFTGVLSFYYKGRKTKSNGVFQVSCIDLDTNIETILEENIVAVANNIWVLKTIYIDRVFTSSNIILKFRKTDNGSGSAFIWNPTLIVDGTDILNGKTKAAESNSLTLTGISTPHHMNTSPTNYSDVGFSSTSFFHYLHATSYRNLIFEIPEIQNTAYSLNISVSHNDTLNSLTKSFNIFITEEIELDFSLSNTNILENISTRPQYSWDFRTNTSDNIMYDDISNYIATLYNNPTIDSVDGVLTGGYGSSNSNGQYVDLQDFAFGAPEFSIEVYFKYVSTSYWQRIFDIGNGTGNSNIVLYRNYNNPNEIILILLNGTNTIIDYASGVMSGTNLQNGVYYHTFLTFSSDTIKVYIDNSLVKTFTGNYSTFLNATRTNALLGRSNWPNDNNQGQINYRYFRVYDKTLSESSVQYYYNNRDNLDFLRGLGLVGELTVTSMPGSLTNTQSDYSYSLGGTDASLFTIDGNVLKSAQVFDTSSNLTGVLSFYYKGRKTYSNGVFQVSCIDLDTNAETILDENIVAVANNTWVLKTISIDRVFTSSNIILKFRKTDNGAGSAFIWNPTLMVDGTDILDGKSKASDSTSKTLTGISTPHHMDTSPTNYSDVGFNSTSFFHYLHATSYRDLIFEIPEIQNTPYSLDISVSHNETGDSSTKSFNIFVINID